MLHFKKAENFLKTAKRTKNLSVFQKLDLPLHRNQSVLCILQSCERKRI